MSILRFLYDQVSLKLKVDFWAFSFHVPQPTWNPPSILVQKKWAKNGQNITKSSNPSREIIWQAKFVFHRVEQEKQALVMTKNRKKIAALETNSVAADHRVSTGKSVQRAIWRAVNKWPSAIRKLKLPGNDHAQDDYICLKITKKSILAGFRAI